MINRLRDEASRARTRYEEAQRIYDHALLAAIATNFSSREAISLRIASEGLADALKEYNEAVTKLGDFVIGRDFRLNR